MGRREDSSLNPHLFVEVLSRSLQSITCHSEPSGVSVDWKMLFKRRAEIYHMHHLISTQSVSEGRAPFRMIQEEIERRSRGDTRGLDRRKSRGVGKRRWKKQLKMEMVEAEHV